MTRVTHIITQSAYMSPARQFRQEISDSLKKKKKPRSVERTEKADSEGWCCLFVFVSYLFRVDHSTDMCSLLQENLLGGKRVYRGHMYMYVERR